MAWPLRHLPPLQHHPLSPLHERLQLLEKFLALVLRHRPHDEINDPLEFSISAFWVGLKQLLERTAASSSGCFLFAFASRNSANCIFSSVSAVIFHRAIATSLTASP